jgi:outer membrane protein
MRRLTFSILSAIFLFSGVVFAQESNLISLDQAIQIAFKNSPSIKLANDQVEKSKAGIRVAKANYYPQVSGSVTEMFQGPAMKVNIPGVGDVNLVDSSTTTAKASAAMPIDINGTLGYYQDLSKIQYFVDMLNLNMAARDLIFNVKESYFNLLRASAAMAATKKSLESSNATLINTRQRYEAGALAKFDVTRAETEVSNINQQYIASKNGVDISRAALNNVLGINVSAPTQVEEITVIVKSADELDRDSAMKLANDKREELKLAGYRLLAARKNVKIQRAGYLPSLGLSADFQHSFKVSGFSASEDSWVVIANLNIPIWTSGLTKAKVDSAFADVKSAEDGITQAKLGIGLGVEIASVNLHNAAEKVSSTQKGVDLAEEALRLANVRYEAGVSTLVEVLDADAALYLARLNNINAQFDYALAKASLDKATASQPEFDALTKQALSTK